MGFRSGRRLTHSRPADRSGRFRPRTRSRCARDGYASFNELLVANMRHAGALRIDHVMGLRRLFIVPDGATGADGAYINYPRSDLIAQVALQSQRSAAWWSAKIWEPCRRGCPRPWRLQHPVLQRVVVRAPTADDTSSAEWRRLPPPASQPTTWQRWPDGGTAPTSPKSAPLSLLDDVAADMAGTARTRKRPNVLALLRSEGLLSADVDPRQPMPSAFAAAVHAFVCATPALLALVQADDLAGETVGDQPPRHRPGEAKLATAARWRHLGIVFDAAGPRDPVRDAARGRCPPDRYLSQHDTRRDQNRFADNVARENHYLRPGKCCHASATEPLAEPSFRALAEPFPAAIDPP